MFCAELILIFWALKPKGSPYKDVGLLANLIMWRTIILLVALVRHIFAA